MVGRNNIFKSPLRYPGGKSCLYGFMTQLLRDNDMIGIDYAEPYAGGAGLALKLLMDEYVHNIYINDLDPSIYAFWKAILLKPNDFCSWIADVEVNVQNWEYYKNIQKNYQIVDSFELAKSTFFLNRTNVSGVISGGPIGGITQLGKFKIDARFNKKDLINKIETIGRFAHRIVLSNQDGLNFVRDLNKNSNDIFIYLDPPYYKKGSLLYLNAFKDENHRQLAELVTKLRKQWLVSYDYADFILNLYNRETIVTYKLPQCTSNRIGDEILIFNKNLQYSQAITHLKSPRCL